MTTPEPVSEEERALMMSVLDGEAAPEQAERLQSLLARKPALRREYDQLTALKELTMQAKPDDPGDTLWGTYWGGVYRRLERGLGWLLLSLGGLVLALYGSWELARAWLTDPAIPLLIRIAGALFAVGSITLLVSVIRERLFFHKHERYKDIER